MTWRIDERINIEDRSYRIKGNRKKPILTIDEPRIVIEDDI